MAMTMKAVARDTLQRVASRPSMWPWIALCAVLIASLDLAFAIAWWAFEGVSPIRILQSVASWALGREAAISGGLATAAFGAALQFCIMLTIAALYFGLSRLDVRLRRQPLRWGALYGAIVYVIQHELIVPYFSAASGPDASRLDWTLACVLVYVTLVGIPCALFARAFVRDR
jgi:hypothetical protein